MTQSASSTHLHSILSELDADIPNQLGRDKEFENRSDLTEIELVFSLLCNTSLFGAPLYRFHASNDDLEGYVKSRKQVTEWLKAIRTDLISPRLEYKIKQLKRLRKSLNALRDDSPASTSLSWYFNELTIEFNISTETRVEDFSRCKNASEYARKMGERLIEFNANDLAVASTRSLQGTYWEQLTKLSDSLRRKQKNKLLIALLLTDSEYTLFADAAISTGCISMAVLLHEDEKIFLQSQFGTDSTTQLWLDLSNDDKAIIKRLSPSRFRPDASLGYINYHVPDNLLPLDWIDTDVTMSYLKSLTRTLDNDLPQLNSDDNNDSSSDADLTYHSDNDGYPVNVKDHGQQTPPSSPPQPLPPVLAPKRFSKPEPADTSRLGIRAREQAFLMKKKDQQAKHPTNQQGSAETPKGIESTIDPEATTSTDPTVFDNVVSTTFQISPDGCPRILARLIATYTDRPASLCINYQLMASPSAHSKHFGASGAIARQIDHQSVLPTDVVILICPSPYSIRYVITTDERRNIVFFNRVYHHLWNKWS